MKQETTWKTIPMNLMEERFHTIQKHLDIINSATTSAEKETARLAMVEEFIGNWGARQNQVNHMALSLLEQLAPLNDAGSIELGLRRLQEFAMATKQN